MGVRETGIEGQREAGGEAGAVLNGDVSYHVSPEHVSLQNGVQRLLSDCNHASA